MSIWRAKNEPLELIVGNLMIAIGGFLIGFRPEQPELSFLSNLSPIFIAAGIFFDVRVLKKFSYELKIIKNEIDSARSELGSTIRDSQNIKSGLDSAKDELNRTVKELQQTKKELDVAELKMKEAEEKIFGSGGSTFSRASWAHPLEREIEALKKQVENLQRKIDSIERGRRF